MHILTENGGGGQSGFNGLGQGWIQPNPSAAGGPASLSFGSYVGLGSGFTMSGLGPGSTNYFSVLSYKYTNNTRSSGGDRKHEITPGGTAAAFAIAQSAEGTYAPGVSHVDGLIFTPGTTITPYTSDSVGIDVLYESTVEPLVAAGYDALNVVPETGMAISTILSYSANTSGCKIWAFDAGHGDQPHDMRITYSGGDAFRIAEQVWGGNRSWGASPGGRIYLPPGYGFANSGGSHTRCYYELL